MAETIVLWFPKPPDNANAHSPGSWRKHNALKKAFVRELDLRAAAKLLPPPPPVPFDRSELTIAWHYPNRRHLLDDENAIRRIKPGVDWLRANGYIVDDASRHLRILPVETIIGAETPPCSTVRLTLTRIL